MKKLFKVLLNLVSFGIPLFIEMLSKSRKFNRVVNQKLTVSLDISDQSGKPVVHLFDGARHLLTLEVDYSHYYFNNE